MTFIFDTGSAWTWIPNEDCPDSQCPHEHYQYHLSTGYINSERVETVQYGIGKIEGSVVNDDVSILPSKEGQAQDVNFLSVYKAKDLSTLESDGLLGLSPRTTRTGYSGYEMHLLVTELQKDGVIDRAIFAVYLTDTSGQSKI